MNKHTIKVKTLLLKTQKKAELISSSAFFYSIIVIYLSKCYFLVYYIKSSKIRQEIDFPFN